jgi:hypothetical protein
MRNVVRVDTADRIACDLIELLHRGASAEHFAHRLAVAEALSNEDPRKCAGRACAWRSRFGIVWSGNSGNAMLAVIESAGTPSRLDLTSVLSAIVPARTQPVEPEPAGSRSTMPSAASSAYSSGRTHRRSRQARRDRGGSVVMSLNAVTTPDYLGMKRCTMPVDKHCATKASSRW